MRREVDQARLADLLGALDRDARLPRHAILAPAVGQALDVPVAMQAQELARLDRVARAAHTHDAGHAALARLDRGMREPAADLHHQTARHRKDRHPGRVREARHEHLAAAEALDLLGAGEHARAADHVALARHADADERRLSRALQHDLAVLEIEVLELRERETRGQAQAFQRRGLLETLAHEFAQVLALQARTADAGDLAQRELEDILADLEARADLEQHAPQGGQIAQRRVLGLLLQRLESARALDREAQHLPGRQLRQRAVRLRGLRAARELRHVLGRLAVSAGTPRPEPLHGPRAPAR